MIYPSLKNTPIKEIVFSISYDEIVDKDCFKKFIELDKISNKFKSIQPSVVLEITNQGIKQTEDQSSYHLKNEKEVLQLRKGSFSYHYLSSYLDYNLVLDTLISFWNDFNNEIKDDLTITSISVRYINVLETDSENLPSRLVQLYPKYSSDRNIINFQNSVQFTYNDFPEYIINVVSAKPQKDFILLDITVSNKIKPETSKRMELKKIFEPLQEIKNKAFFDSITAKALIKYI